MTNLSTQPLKEKTLGQLLDDTVARYPDNEALVYPKHNVRSTYKEFGETVNKLAKGLMYLGVQKGDTFAIWATNIPFWVELQFATAKIGATLLTINTLYKKSELTYLLKQSKTQYIATIDRFRDCDYIQLFYELIPELKSQPRGKLQSKHFPNLRNIVFLGKDEQEGMFTIFEIIELGKNITDKEYKKRQESISPFDIVNMQYTSGTTGFPKGVQLTHYNIGNNGWWIGKNQNFTDKDRVCLPVPLFHCFGCVLGVLATLSHGATLIVLEEYTPVHVMTIIEKEKCTALYGVPTMFIAILEHRLFQKFNFSLLRTGIMAGSICPTLILEQVMNKMNIKEITVCYGLTESSPAITQTRINDDPEKMLKTVGRPLPGIEIRIVDPKNNTLPTETQGEICCRGYNIMKGYFDMPEETAKAIDSDGWLHTGDLGKIDSDGYLYITGRLKDMIIRGGENIYPREIEEFLYKIPGISDVQVVGVKNRKLGEEVMAFIILQEGFQYTPEEIRDYCRGKIARYKIPRHIAFVKSFPLTANGKVQKFKLQEQAAKLLALDD